MLKVKASILEDGLVEEVEKLIENNPRLFENETVVLMADAHKTGGIPVGFTMTLSKGLVPVDFVSADIGCGVTSILIKDYVISPKELKYFSTIVRDIVPVNRTIVKGNFGNGKIVGILSGLGTLGSGNHFLEIGTNGKDTMISVHSGSRDYGGDFFKETKRIAKEHTKEYYREERVRKLQDVEPKDRENYLKSLPKVSDLALLDTSKYEEYYYDLNNVVEFAKKNRRNILENVIFALGLDCMEHETIESIHNYIDTSGDVPIVRKGSIQAKNGEKVVIPINMRDGIIVGIAKDTGEVNYSLPHGAGRILSRTKAFEKLDFEDFKSDMNDVISPTVVVETLDESPRAYKDLETILKDIKPYLRDYEVFKTVFNYKGV